MAMAGDSLRTRIMTFNVEEGGTGVDFDKVVEAIQRADPDIVALQEAVGNTDRVADALAWRYASVRTQVISRHPIADPPDDPAYVLVELQPGRVVAVASIHLPAEPYGPDLARLGGGPDEVIGLERSVRLPALEPVLAEVAQLVAADLPVFLLGDFNAPSHLDRRADGRDFDWPISRAVEAAGFRDAWREMHPDSMSAPGLTWWADRPPTGGYEPRPDTPHDRIDFIFAAGPAVATDAVLVGEVGRSGVALGVDPWPSDHRAVLATFEVRPTAMDLDSSAIGPNDRSIGRRPPGNVTVETVKSDFAVGEPIEIRWEGGPGYRWDWIAIFAAGRADLSDRQLIWLHTGARRDGSVRLDAAAALVDQSPVGGRWPLPVGEYEAIYLLDDGPRPLGRASFRIIPATGRS